MKCPVCWAEKAYRCRAKGIVRRLLAALRIVVPLRCRHCYHTFSRPWILTLGQCIEPPIVHFQGRPAERDSYAAQSVGGNGAGEMRQELGRPSDLDGGHKPVRAAA